MQLIGRSNELGPLVLRIKRSAAGAGAFTCRTPVLYNSQSFANCKLMLKEQFKNNNLHYFTYTPNIINLHKKHLVSGVKAFNTKVILDFCVVISFACVKSSRVSFYCHFNYTRVIQFIFK